MPEQNAQNKLQIKKCWTFRLIDSIIIGNRSSRTGNRGCEGPKGRRRGKSGLHRAGCRITSGGGDSQASATEKNRRQKAGKGEKVR